MNRVKKIFPVIAVLLVCGGGCMFYKSIHLAGIEPSMHPLRNAPYEILGEAETIISNFNLLWAISVTPRPDFEKAILEMANEKGGDDVIEVRWWRERQQWIVGMVTVIHIKGTVIKYK
jgi:hypothetical protein